MCLCANIALSTNLLTGDHVVATLSTLGVACISDVARYLRCGEAEYVLSSARVVDATLFGKMKIEEETCAMEDRYERQ